MNVSSEFRHYLQEIDRWLEGIQDDLNSRSGSTQKESITREIKKLKEIKSKNTFQDAQNQTTFFAQVDRIANMYNHFFGNGNVNEEFVPIGGHTLPPLPYSYDALEPVISEEIMRIHHDEHHQAYVDGLNKAELEMQTARETGDFDLIGHWEREAAFHGAGHYLHTMFWGNMSPDGGGEPSGRLREQIEKDFGSYQAFKEHFTAAANKVQGVGWAILVWSPRSRRLEILQAEFHHLLSQWDAIPLLGLDVWEHAYYLQYKNGRAEYVDNFWNIINWENVNERYEKARELKWEPF